MLRAKPTFVRVVPRAAMVLSVLHHRWAFPALYVPGAKLISICDEVTLDTDLAYASYSGGIWADTETAKLGLSCLGVDSVLSLVFTDSTPNIADGASILFTSAQARNILDYVSDVSETPIYVHCAAGVSRSGAVGLFLCRYFGLSEQEFNKLNPHIMPNSYVLAVLMQESGLTTARQTSLSDIFV